MLSTQLAPLDSPESITDLAWMLGQLENAVQLAELLSIKGFTRDRLNRAARQLPPEQQQRLREWAIENKCSASTA